MCFGYMEQKTLSKTQVKIQNIDPEKERQRVVKKAAEVILLFCLAYDPKVITLNSLEKLYTTNQQKQLHYNIIKFAV